MKLKQYILAALLPGALALNAGDRDVLRSPMPERWTYDSAMEQQLPGDDLWWRWFDDPVLDSLVSMAENANFDVLAAGHRMEAARRAMQEARAGYFPVIAVQGGYSRQRAHGISFNNYDLQATASWQIDLFGKVTASARKAKSQYKVSRAEWVGTMVSMAGQLATNYIQLRVWQAELDVARRHIERQDTVAGIANSRFECGLASKIDVEQARSILYSTRASVPQLETSVHTAISAIALLLGVYPSDIQPMLERERPLPPHIMPVSAGVPAQLLRRRPDVAAAEYNLAAAAAALGIAKKDFLPTLTIEGSVGVSSDGHGKFFSDHNLAYSVGPTLSWTIFDGMARSARVASAREEMEALTDTYNYTVMNAFNEVDNALYSYTNALRTVKEYEAARDASAEFYRLSIDLYTKGLSDFTNVANAQIDLLNYSNSVITARGEALSALVSLYEALGGGFGLPD